MEAVDSQVAGDLSEPKPLSTPVGDQKSVTRETVLLRERLLKLVQNNVGEANCITGDELLKYLNHTWPHTYAFKDTRRIRQTFDDLIELGYPICSRGGVGYWWPATLNEIFETGDREFREKARTMLRKRRILREAGIRLFSGQRQLV